VGQELAERAASPREVWFSRWGGNFIQQSSGGLIHLGLERLPVLLRRFDPAIRKVDVRLPGKGNSDSHGARPVHLIIMMIKWIRTWRAAPSPPPPPCPPWLAPPWRPLSPWSRVQGSWIRVQGSGFRVQGSGFRVQGSGFRV